MTCTGEHVSRPFFVDLRCRDLVSSTEGDRSTVRPVMNTLRLLCGAFLVVAAAGCAPSLAPLYQDYAVRSEEADERTARVHAALEDAGWEIVEDSMAPSIATITAPITHRQWGLYRISVFVEAVPMGERHVRLLIHPYREYVWGRKSKLPFLTSSLRRSVVADLNEAFEARGLTVHRQH